MLSPSWSQGRGPLAFLPQRLFRTDLPVAGYVLLAWVLSLGGSLLLGLALGLLAPEADAPSLGDAPAGVILFTVVVLSPVVETIIMGAILLPLMRWLSAWQAVLASALIWGIGHSLASAVWGLVIWWPFTIFSLAFVTWRPRGFWWAVLLVSTIHMLQNLPPAIAIVWPG